MNRATEEQTCGRCGAATGCRLLDHGSGNLIWLCSTGDSESPGCYERTLEVQAKHTLDFVSVARHGIEHTATANCACGTPLSSDSKVGAETARRGLVTRWRAHQRAVVTGSTEAPPGPQSPCVGSGHEPAAVTGSRRMIRMGDLIVVGVGKCPECGRPGVALRGDGLLRVHVAKLKARRGR